MIVGEASVLITPNWSLFEKEMAAGSVAPLGKFEKDAEAAGSRAGSRMSHGFSSGTKGISTALSGLGLPLGTFGGHLNKTAESMARVEKGGHGMTQSLAAFGGNVLMGATAGLVAFGAAAVDVAVKGEKVTAGIANSAGISVAAAKRISKAFGDTMGSLEFSGQELGKAYTDVAGVLGQMAGHALNAGQALTFMRSSSDLAEGAQISLESSTQDLMKVMQAYHLQVNESSRAGDILFNTSRVTGISIDQLTSVLGRLKGRLGDVAPSLAESSAVVAALAHNGVTGRQSMTALNGSFTTLIGGSKKTKEMAKELGLTIFDTTGKFMGIKSIIDQLQPKLAGLSEQQQLEATKALFGASANKQMLGVVMQGPAVFEANARTVAKAGAAHEAAKKQAETFTNQIERLKNTVIDLAEKFGNILIPKLVWLGKAIADSIVWLEKHKWAAIALATTITTVLGAAITAFVVTKAIAFVGAVRGMIASLASLMGVSSTAAEVVSADSSVMAGSFISAAAASSTAAGTITIGETTIAGAVTTADDTIVAANTAAAASFMAMLGPIALVAAAVVALNEILPKGENVESLLGGNQPGEKGREGEVFMNKKASQKTLDTGGGIMAFFEAKGLTPAQAAGIVGNIQQESSLNPNAPGGGLFQDIGSRSASGTGSITHQLEAAWRELQGMPSTLAHLRKAKTPQEAAWVFSSEFERPGKPELAKREKYAAEALAAHPQAAHSKAVEQDTASTRKHNAALEKAVEALGQHTKHTKTAKAKAEAYADPFASATGLKRSRTDQGVDFSFAGPLGAIGAGTIARIIQDPGGFGTELVEKLTAGAHKGQYVYYGLETGATSTTRAGAHVRAGQEIARGKGSGGIELGFASGPGGVPITPFAKGASHEKPTAGGEEFSKFLASIGKGGSALSTASQLFANEQKAVAAFMKKEATRIAGDTKIANTYLTKEVAAIHSGKISELVKFVGKTHDTYLHRLEAELNRDHRDALMGMAGIVEKEHASALSKMVSKLVATHKEALEALKKALVAAAEKKSTENLKHEDVVNKQVAENAATAIGDATKVRLDHAAEKGLGGPELAAAQAQTNVDAVKQANDAAIGAAKLALDEAAGKGELVEAQAQHALDLAENKAKVSEAEAMKTLDLANLTASEAAKSKQAEEERAKKTEENKKALEENTSALKEKQAASSLPPISFTIEGQNITAGQVFAELGWIFKTGVLPPAPVPVAH